LEKIRDGSKPEHNSGGSILMSRCGSIPVSGEAIPEIESLGVIYCIDGSLFPTMSSMLWAEYKKIVKPYDYICATN